MSIEGPKLSTKKLETDKELVAFVEQATLSVKEGRITTTASVHEALEQLGSHYGPFGADFTELENAINELKIECAKKGI